MLRKVKLIAFAVVAALCGFFYILSACRGERIKDLQTEKTTINEKLTRCKNEVESYFKAEQRASSAIGEIRTVVKTVKSPCDCYNSNIDVSIADRVRGK